VLGELYEDALAGLARPEIEYVGRPPDPRCGSMTAARHPGRCLDPGPLPGEHAGRRLRPGPAHRGAGRGGACRPSASTSLPRPCSWPGRAGRWRCTGTCSPRSRGPGRWARVLLADGNIGIGGDPDALLSRVAELLKPLGQALVEVEPPGAPLAKDMVRLSHAGQCSSWFPWASIGADQISELSPQRRAGGHRGLDRRRPLVRRPVPGHRLMSTSARAPRLRVVAAAATAAALTALVVLTVRRAASPRGSAPSRWRPSSGRFSRPARGWYCGCPAAGRWP